MSKHFAGDVFESYSAGTEIKPQINWDTVHLMKPLYGIDMGKTQRSKPLSGLQPIDIVVTTAVVLNVPVCSVNTGRIEGWAIPRENATRNLSGV